MKISILTIPLFLFLGIRSAISGSDGTPAVQETPTDTGAIIWDQSSLKKVSASTSDGRYSGYARMVQLQDKSLIVIYESSGNVVIVKSTDLGNNWSDPVLIAARKDGVNMSVPDILELKDHTLLACYNPRPSRNVSGKHFGIRTKRSVDGGKSWQDERLVYEAGTQFENGCWEPAVIQLPNGELQLFFANEGPYTNSNEQEISMVRSVDGGLNWSGKAETISFRKSRRDGMPVPVLLNHRREIAFAIEDNAGSNFKPYIIKNTLKENWGKFVDGKSPNRVYALKDRLADSIYAGAPYLRQLKTGQTILSYQGTEGRKNKMEYADMKVVVGDERAENFYGKTSPFQIPLGKSCLWNSLCVLEDNTIVALTSTNAYSDRTEVYMIKGRLKARPLTLADPTIFADQGKYYLYGTSSNKGFEVYESSDLIHWAKPKQSNNGFALQKGESFGNSGFWAPQLFKHKGHYYMAYTADEQIAIAESKHPYGPFRQKRINSISGEGKQIDPFVFFDTNGKIYLYNVKLKEGNRIYVSEMKPDLSDIVSGTSKECISGDLPWENTAKTKWPVTEGPTVIKHGKTYYMIYSANDFRSKDYAVGYATASSPIGPWKKFSGNPIISSEMLGYNGTGHGDIFADQNGAFKYVMHTHRSVQTVSPRMTGIINMKFEGQKERPDTLEALPETFRILMKEE